MSFDFLKNFIKKFFAFLIFFVVFLPAFSQDISIENNDFEDDFYDFEAEEIAESESDENAENEQAENSENSSENPDEEKKQKRPREKILPFHSRFNQKGDQYIKIALMFSFPLNFGGRFPLFKGGQIAMGGSGELGYHRFLTPWFAVGADVGFGYNPTIEKNIFTCVPILITATIQPAFGRIEVPLTFAIGGAYESYLKKHYFPGLIIKPQFGVFFRALPGWSFGLETHFMIVPQTYSDKKYNATGFFETLAIVARYHF